MSWYPIAFLPPQQVDADGVPYSGAVLKAYEPNTTTVIPMATDYTGVTTASSVALNASGYPVYGGNVIIPHVQENYKLALYPTQAAADADSGALWTVDDIQIADATNTPFIQYFSGDGTTTDFTLSSDLGTDETILMVFADKEFPEYSTNGTFASDANWTKGAGWTIAAGVATATGAISTNLEQNTAIPLIEGESYTLKDTATRSAGTITANLGGTAGTARSASGTYSETFIAGSTQAIIFTTSGFTGTVDSVSVHPTNIERRNILRPNEYTLSGTTLSITEAPATGTNNILVFAPALLLGAAAASAAAAATSETNAAASATAAAASATASSNSAAAAAASYDSFDDRYLGSKAVEPTLDNDGNALLEGALYWNSVDKVMKVYNGTAWETTILASYLVSTNNLNDVSNPTTARTNLSAAASGANDDITSLLALNSVNGAGVGGLRNLLVNGSFEVWQRGTSFALTSSYTLVADQWKAALSSGTGWTLSRQTLSEQSSSYGLRVDRPAAGTTTATLKVQQVVESMRVPRFRGKKATVSFDVIKGANFSPTSMVVALYSGTGTDEATVESFTGSAVPAGGSITIDPVTQ